MADFVRPDFKPPYCPATASRKIPHSVLIDMTALTQQYPASSYDLASPLKRFYAVMIDVGIAHVIFITAELIIRWIGPLFSPEISPSLVLMIMMSPWLFSYLYLVFGDALPGGQSVGKRVMKIAVVGFPFEMNCTVFQSVLRNLPKVLFSLLDAIFLFFGHRRRFGDMLAGTIVVNSK
ncbi:RDD family protein [Pseudomonas sp. 3A(2025)]